LTEIGCGNAIFRRLVAKIHKLLFHFPARLKRDIEIWIRPGSFASEGTMKQVMPQTAGNLFEFAISASTKKVWGFFHFPETGLNAL